MIFKRACLNLFSLFTLICILVVPAVVYAGPWQIQPFVETRIGYSDNIEFDDDDEEESGFIGQINPGVSIVKDQGRLQVNLNYVMQNFYYFDDSQHNADHNLDSVARYAIIPNTFFLNGYADITKVVVDNDRQISVDNLNSTGNTTDETTLGIEPQWVQSLGSYAQADLAYLYAVQKFDDETEEDGVEGDIDDNDRQRFLASLQNADPDSDRLDWALRYRNEKVDFEDGDTFDFVTQLLELGYQVTSRIELVGSYGYEDNDLGTITAVDDDDEDTFWTAGAVYNFGEFSFLEVRRGERFFGKTWFGNLVVGGPKLQVDATYEESTDLAVFDSIDTGLQSPTNALENDIDGSVTEDRDSVSISKDWDVGIAYNVSKSTFLASYVNEDQEFLDSADTEKFEAYEFGWIWQITGASSLFTSVEFQEDNSVDLGVETESEFFDFSVVYTRSLSPKTDFDVDYTYAEGEFDDGEEDFTSNTISVGLVHRF